MQAPRHPGRPPGRDERWPLTGRAHELAALDELLATGPVVVAGPAGVGKSRLVAEWLRSTDRRIVRVLATRATATVPFGAFAPWAGEPGAVPEHRLDALQAIVARILDEGDDPVVAVDDAHLLDPGSAAVVLHLVLHTPARVVATIRSGAPAPDPVQALWHQGGGTRLDLGPLPEADTVALAAARLGGRVDAFAQHRLWSLSLGNPMYLREVTEAALEQGRLRQRDGSWTWDGGFPANPQLVELVTGRLGTLDGDDRRVLELVALGEPLSASTLAALTGEERVVELERRGLLVVEPGVDDLLVRLVHPIYAEVLRSTMGPLVTRRHHGDLVRASAGRRSVEDPLRVALWSLGGDGARPDVDVVVRAAVRALNVWDAELALRLATMAEDAGAGAQALWVRAEALAALDRRAELDEVLTRLAADRDPASRASSAKLGAYLVAWTRQDADEALALLLDNLRDAPPESRGVLASTAATFAVHALRLDAAAAHAAEVGRSLPVPPSLPLQGVTIDGFAAALGGNPRPALDVVTQRAADIIAVTPDDPIPGGYAATGYQFASALAGRLDEAAAFFGNLLAAAEVTRILPFRALPAMLLGRTECERGRLVAAAAHLRDALDLMGDDSPFWFGRPVMCAADLAVALAQQGDAAGAAEAVAVAERRRDGWVAMTAHTLAMGRAWASVAAGELGRARSQALEAADEADRRGATFLTLKALSIVVRCGAADGVAARLTALAARRPSPLAEALDCFATALADHDGHGLDAAAEAFAGMGARLVAAEAATCAAVAHERAGLHRNEAASRHRAHELLAGCERPATPLLAGLDARPVAAELTDREREVVLMAVAGRTNRDIAASLGISVRTVNSHLNHAYTKLGTSDRVALADRLRPGGRSDPVGDA